MLKTIQSHLKGHKHRRLIIAISVFLFIILVMIIFRISAAINLRNETLAAAVPVVRVMTAEQEKGVDKIILPGNVQAWHESPIFARANGYIKKWYVDIGSHVKKGDLLAVIETPELDAQERQARADLKTAIANNQLAQITARRWLNLVKTKSVSQQETDEKVSTAAALDAAMFAAKANLQRLQELVGFQRVIAPFDGVITARATDIGDLIDAGSSSTAPPLFRIAQTKPLRIYVKIPQYYSSRIKPDMTVKLHFAEHPKQVFPAKLFETAQAIDPKTRTLLAQFVTPNKNGELLPGSYTEVWLSLPIPPKTVILPVNTLLFQAPGLQVATLDKDNKIVLKSVTLRRDFGSTVEIATGVLPGDRVVLNPPDAIRNGETVRVVS
ncbi:MULTISPECIES: efflux RND transporter periplasmic adaptor subunit [Legionella]|uniref:Efflux RND transporter periplasmic adaptor subunit n=1 Tax=Legionella resiliens TaxID=2905958 RepID=A0ABS8X5G8_9GAMM|nr:MULTISPECIES: efflux RND transporter periplasmic adaptor subunit [unclassified Legionella]MCE0724856.1 efflux RND transporter periplasmic adaptor subunit [Legionella sp. 9fVS26]MCE3534010.1 efflux RND transporter periplasmic adaptor subunit [Legionella sp. 8cVS16]QLZ70245.1 efflux RND transporter periplasmic adaptor subunit [Legionella sp. PC1000]